MKPEILERQTVHAGYIRVERIRLRLAGGAVVVREIEHHGDAVAVLPFDALARTALIVRLFRLPPFDRLGQAVVDEACAGMIDGEDEAGAVRREALEELGLRLDAPEFAGRVWPSPGVSAERVSLFLAPYGAADRVAAGGGVAAEHENITVVERRLVDLATDADAGRIADLKLFALVQTLRLRRPELFIS